MRNPKILVCSGSVRGGSFNGKLAALAAKKLAILDADVTHLSLKDYPLPIYDGDLEETSGAPENARKLKRLFLANDGVFLSCPEYNAGVTPLLKNTLDWISRVKEPGDPYRNKMFALGSASPGAYGGMRGLIGMRTILEVGLGAMVLPQMVAVSKAASAFDDKGELSDERVGGQLDKLVEGLLRATRIEMSH
ncbi:predicted flavoprotein [Stappia aggregata IAM 12614]|uniref:Predicted flavoprotein n=1 Tax=Roseibium aggregatum (strain ATCC 25650 / DSM 13394 / JCM 20685 / NBRC 16684 / NCIMB 2208 / IAM 12614 / B1) TaxID=384765 RepID=A0NUH8_ROSAI|nr:NAD(P)H-dependent oxidoreductase [Roseibium aggregatum]EAV43580.1 predicted flavoprotein [Stappia aggregata IAM 12614] [Roseibium aggregatum IAM 12614]